MTDQGHRLAGIVEGLDQSDGVGAFSEVPHGAVTAYVEYGVEVFRLHIGKPDRLRKRLLRRLVLLEPRHRGGLILWQIALWIDRGLPAFRGGQRQLDTSVPEDKVRGGEFLKPEAGFAASVAELIVGC